MKEGCVGDGEKDWENLGMGECEEVGNEKRGTANQGGRGKCGRPRG